jgi:hypothetical protein
VCGTGIGVCVRKVMAHMNIRLSWSPTRALSLLFGT